jgi:enoyl-CoA hydratase/carnithine racemase
MTDELTCFTVRLDVESGVQQVRMSRGKQLNSMTSTFFEETRRIFTAANDDSRIRCIVLSGAGRMFSAGLDLKDAASLLVGDSNGNDDDDDAREHGAVWKAVQRMQAAFLAVEECRKPIVCAVHGNCIGGALELALACDVRLCSADASFSVRETRVAIVADLGMLHRIVRVCGRSWANYLALTGADVSAAAARDAGIVSHVCATHDELLARANEIATLIAANSPLTVQGVKHVLQYSAEHSPRDSLSYVALWNQSFLRNPDLSEAMSSFFEKRKPRFKANL